MFWIAVSVRSDRTDLVPGAGCVTRTAAMFTSAGHFRFVGYAGWLSAMFAPLLLLTSRIPTAGGKVFATQMSPRVVNTQYGQLRGLLVTLPNPHLPQVDAYLGLQYASVLGGDLRFMPPTSPLETWDGIRVAMQFRPVCPQKLPDIERLEKTLPLGRVDHYKRILPFLGRQAEECLNLNVYVPVRGNNETEPLPVVIFIHGESYDFGTGNAYDGSVLAAFGKVIVITLNYRLGALGFLSLEDSNAPGNQAILDQVAALHWIRENIAAFGGNPQEVTLLGQGYGGALVNLLLISPVTKGKSLFKRAIIESGSALSTWALSRDPLRYTRELADHVNCSHLWGENIALLQCFKQKPYEDLVLTDIRAPKYYSAFAPVVDRRSVLPTDIRSLMRAPTSAFGDTGLLLGVMKNEGFLYFNQQEVDDGVSHDQLQRVLRTYVRNVYQYQRQKIYEILLYQYSDWERPRDPDVIRDNLMDMLGDGQITAPMVELGHLHAAYNTPTYMYAFHYPSRLDTYPRWAGGVHGDDMTYVFGAPLADGIAPFISTYTRQEKMLTEAILTYWTNFMKTGNPNIPRNQKSAFTSDVENRFEELTWPKYDNIRQEYLHIGMRPIARHHYRANEMAFWLELLPKIHRSDGLPPEYHLLHDYNNKSTFETEGTRELNLDDMLPTTTTSTSPPPTTVTTTVTTTSTSSTAPPTTTPTTTTTRRPTPSPTESARDRKQTTRDEAFTTTKPYAAGITARDGTLSLSVTIAVGCSLLFLNILIFAGVYYQKDRLRIELKQRQQELLDKQKDQQQQQQQLAAGEPAESENNFRSSGADTGTDTNSSSMVTPTMAPCLVRQHLQSPITTLPKQSIPVIPPQAPYHHHTAPRSHNIPLHHQHHLGRTAANHTPDGGTVLKRAPSGESIEAIEPRDHGSPRTDIDHHGNPSTVV